MAEYSRETIHYPDGTLKIKQTVSDSEIHEEIFEPLNLIQTDSKINEMENKIVVLEKGSNYLLNHLDSDKTEEIFTQIDLTQARITKDQEEIEVLAKETDKLLNKLEYMAS